MLPNVTPQLVGNTGLRALRAAIAEPDRFACEPKVDGVRGLVVYTPDRTIETRNRTGIRRDWLRSDGFEFGLRRLPNRLPLLWNGTVLDGELTAGRFATTMAALFGAKRHRPDLRFVVFDVPILAGATRWPCSRRSGAFGQPLAHFNGCQLYPQYWAGLSVNRLRSVPSRSTIHRSPSFTGPPGTTVNSRRVPSGDQTAPI